MISAADFDFWSRARRCLMLRPHTDLPRRASPRMVCQRKHRLPPRRLMTSLPESLARHAREHGVGAMETSLIIAEPSRALRRHTMRDAVTARVCHEACWFDCLPGE